MPSKKLHPAAAAPPTAPFTHLTGPNCFACDRRHRTGLRVAFRRDPAGPPGSVRASTRISRRFGGPPGLVHGGVIATLLDEAMTKVTAMLGVFAVTARLEVDLQRPLPLGSRVKVYGRPLSRKERVLHHDAWLTDERGKVIARGRSLFVVPKPALAKRILRAAGR